MRLKATDYAVTADDRRWQDEAESTARDPLSDLRVIAGRRSTAIASLLGVFGTVSLIAGPAAFEKVAAPWREVLGGLVIFALVFGLLATGLASRAAGGRVIRSWTTANAMRQAYETEFDAAERAFRWSGRLSALSISALIVAVALSLYAPRKVSTPVAIPSGAPVCFAVDQSGSTPVVTLGECAPK